MAVVDATIALVAGSGWASGLNLYLVWLLVGLGTRFGFVDGPSALGSWWVIGVAGGLLVVEEVVDKIVLADSAWDVPHTVIRPVGAALLGYLLTGEIADASQAAWAAGSGTLALVSHTGKAALRAVANLSPEPFSNIALSVVEDGLAVSVLVAAVIAPIAAVVAVVLLTGASTTGGAVAIRRLRRRRRARTADAPTGPSG